MQRQVELIGAAWGLGGADPGCAEAPAVLTPLVLARLEACGVPARVGPILEAPAGERRKAFAVSRLCRELAGAVAAARRRGRLACVIGGDHTCAGGTWTGVARTLSADLGLVWIDAHGQPYAGDQPHRPPARRAAPGCSAWTTTRSTGSAPACSNRSTSVSSACAATSRRRTSGKLGVRVVFMDEIRSRGIDAVLDEALDIATAGTSGFGVSIDLDVIEPEEAPHVGTPVTGGVTSAELARARGHRRRAWSPRSSSSNTARG